MLSSSNTSSRNKIMKCVTSTSESGVTNTICFHQKGGGRSESHLLQVHSIFTQGWKIVRSALSSHSVSALLIENRDTGKTLAFLDCVKGATERGMGDKKVCVHFFFSLNRCVWGRSAASSLLCHQCLMKTRLSWSRICAWSNSH